MGGLKTSQNCYIHSLGSQFSGLFNTESNYRKGTEKNVWLLLIMLRHSQFILRLLTGSLLCELNSHHIARLGLSTSAI